MEIMFKYVPAFSCLNEQFNRKRPHVDNKVLELRLNNKGFVAIAPPLIL